jgi:hypothetical protein
MMKNVGRIDRAARGLLAIAMLVGACLAPLPAAPRVGMAALATYFAITVLLGTCLGYRLMGMSSCPRSPR